MSRSRPKVLICTPRNPWPTMSGPDLRCWQVVQLVNRVAETALFALAGDPRNRPEGVAHWHIAGLETNPDPTDRSWLTRPKGLPSDSYYIEDCARQLREMLAEFRPDAVVLDALAMHGYEGLIHATGVPVIFNTHNVEADLARALTDSETSLPAKLLRKRFADRVAEVEAGMVERAAETWVCSDRDRQLLLNWPRSGEVRVVPNAIDVDRIAQPQDRPAQLSNDGPNFLYCGLFHYAPNQHAAEVLIHHVFPELAAKHAGSRLILAGHGPTAKMREASAADPRIVVTGRVPDIRPFLQHSTMLLAPISTGGGTRFKLLEAFAAQLPVITTAKGAEGLDAIPREHYLLAEDPASFVDAVDRTLASPEETAERVRAARQLVQRYSWDAAAETVAASMHQVLSR